MADKFLLNDYGSVIWLNNEAWVQNGTSTLEVPNDTLNAGDGDVANIQPSITYNNADPQGKTIYSAQEEAVATNRWNIEGVVGDTLSTLIANIQTSGVLRVWADSVGPDIEVYINGIFLANCGDTQAEAYPINVQANDVVEVKNVSTNADRVCKALIYPFVYAH